MSKFGKRETAEPASKGVVETVKSAASSVAAKVTGSSADFFTSGATDSKRKGKTWKVEQAGVQADENGRQYTVNSVGDRQYSDGFLPGVMQGPRELNAPGSIAPLTTRPGGMHSRRMATRNPILTTDQHNERRGIASRAQEWFENILSIGAGR